MKNALWVHGAQRLPSLTISPLSPSWQWGAWPELTLPAVDHPVAPKDHSATEGPGQSSPASFPPVPSTSCRWVLNLHFSPGEGDPPSHPQITSGIPAPTFSRTGVGVVGRLASGLEGTEAFLRNTAPGIPAPSLCPQGALQWERQWGKSSGSSLPSAPQFPGLLRLSHLSIPQ